MEEARKEREKKKHAYLPYYNIPLPLAISAGGPKLAMSAPVDHWRAITYPLS